MDLLASHADVLRLVTRSSPRGEERVTSLRTSAWEAMDLHELAKRTAAVSWRQKPLPDLTFCI